MSVFYFRCIAPNTSGKKVKREREKKFFGLENKWIINEN